MVLVNSDGRMRFTHIFASLLSTDTHTSALSIRWLSYWFPQTQYISISCAPVLSRALWASLSCRSVYIAMVCAARAFRLKSRSTIARVEPALDVLNSIATNIKCCTTPPNIRRLLSNESLTPSESFKTFLVSIKQIERSVAMINITNIQNILCAELWIAFYVKKLLLQ